MEKYNEWNKKVTDDAMLAELASMDAAAIENAFYKDLEFGTAGLRGVMAAGSNCLNIYTIVRATRGVADYMVANKMKSAAVTFDSRLNSQRFAEATAQVLAASGIKTYLTEECQPTPFLSFMVRTLGCDIGINITASHNPKQYNGYKVYDGSGCQLTDDAANAVTGYIEAVDPFAVKLAPLTEYIENNLVAYTDVELKRQYLNAVLAQNINSADGIKVAYTPLCGAGHKLVPEILHLVGVKDVAIVREQGTPDGNFTTCPFPNPEKKEAMQLAIELGNKEKADIVIGTDPDCDRMSAAVRHNGQYVHLTGNEIGVLLTSYILGELKQRNSIPEGAVVVKTIVTSSLTDRIAADYGVTVRNVLTGFKYIGNEIGELEALNAAERFLFGFEESSGYLRGTYVRDKDAVVASMLIAEMCATMKKQGKTLVDVLEGLYKIYGKYEHKVLSYQFDGAAGAEVKQKLLDKIRRDGFKDIGGSEIVDSLDYLTQQTLPLPKADVMQFESKDGTLLIVRPSGTEPLIKNYITVSGRAEENKEKFGRIEKQLNEVYVNRK
jgi:phosphoglucomutase